MPYARIAAVGSALPERLVPNAEFEELVDTSDD
ncbi:MAG TPA: 3-oxoacyl-ACP synthase, partial [Actinomycetota bacterium]|nr:3-oxoacyl-ACP synthase [Actinomycetota bacterium]